MSQSGTTHLGPGGGGGKVSVNDLSITKWIDKSSPTLMQACCAGKHFPSAALMCRRAGKKPVPLIKIEMEEVMVSSVATGHAERDDRPTENITLNFAKFKVTYTPTKPDGSAAAPIGPMGWDISANTKL